MPNLFTDLGITDPDGDALRVTHISGPPLGKRSVTPGGSRVGGLYNGESDTQIEVFSNGDYVLTLGAAKTGRYGPQAVSFHFDYGDDKADDHSADGAPDVTDYAVTFQFTGDLSANNAPTNPGPNAGTIVVA